MKEEIRTQLTEIQSIVRQLTDAEYTTGLEVLSGSSIGQHVRHILEFYICLLRSFESGIVSYDQRERDVRTETERLFAAHSIDYILHDLTHVKQDRILKMHANFTCDSEMTVECETSVNRELAYVLEHGIHHQALLKIGIRQLHREELLSDKFGIAYSTIRFQNRPVSEMANYGE